MKKTLAVPDMHLPWVDVKALEGIYSAITRERPERIIQLGDIYDSFAHSKFPKTLEMTPKEEQTKAVLMGNAFWKNVNKLSPKSEKIQIVGNHCVRALKRCQEKCPELMDLVRPTWEGLFQFKGVKTILDPRELVMRDGVAYNHGWLTRLGAHMRELGMNFCCGHTHRPGVVFERLNGSILFELNCGLIGDIKSKVFGYTAVKHSKWTKGYGIIDPYGPRFIPFYGLD